MELYKEISLTALEPFDINVEIVAALLGQKGFEGSAEDEFIKAYILEKEKTDEEIKVVIQELIEQGYIDDKFEITLIEPKNWNEEWEKNYFQPILIGNQCLIKSSFHKTDIKAKYEIIIDPKMSFGTGHHETTSMMAEYLLETKLGGYKIMDMGTGTGILGILCSMIGCDSIVGIDNDSWCYENAQENIEVNHIKNFEMKLGDAGLLKNYPNYFDLMIANINRHILLSDLKYYNNCLVKSGTLLLSGFYKEDLEMIKEEAKQQGFEFLSKNTKNNWVGAKFKKI